MRRAIAISFLLIFLTTHTAFGQFLRVPVLVHHYLEHVEQDNFSLFQFLSEHYTSKINHPDDQHHDHEKLPFKSTQNQTSQVVMTVPYPIFSFVQRILKTVEIKITIRNTQHYSNAYLNSIWQPPRFS